MRIHRIAIVLLAACGHGDDVGAFVGSCGMDQMQCIDYGVGFSVDDVKGFCPTKYTMTPCPSANRQGHCIFDQKNASGVEQTFRVSYYAQVNLTDVCNLNMGTPFKN